MGNTPQPVASEQSKVDRIAELVKAAVENGDIEAYSDKITIHPDSSPTQKKEEKEFNGYRAKNRAGALALVGGEEDQVWKLFNQAYDLRTRQRTRQQFLATFEDPMKAFRKAATALQALGLSIHKGLSVEDIALALKAQADAQGQAEDEAAVTE